MTPKVTICVLTYGDFLYLARRAIESIRHHCQRTEYQLVVGANAVAAETLAYLQELERLGEIDHLLVSPANINKCPMMRRMFDVVQTEFIWWFDDDSHITEPGALSNWLGEAQKAPPSTVMWGRLAFCVSESFTDLESACQFVRSASWYRGLPPPSWRPGGKGVFDFQNRGTGDGRWFFPTGGCWLIRTNAVRSLDWPDRRLVKLADDVFLGEAVRQNGWDMAHISDRRVAISAERRRGKIGSTLSSSSRASAALGVP